MGSDNEVISELFPNLAAEIANRIRSDDREDRIHLVELDGEVFKLAFPFWTPLSLIAATRLKKIGKAE